MVMDTKNVKSFLEVCFCQNHGLRRLHRFHGFHGTGFGVGEGFLFVRIADYADFTDFTEQFLVQVKVFVCQNRV